MPTIEDVKKFLKVEGIPCLEFEEDTPTAETAALAVGCTPAEIAKTVLFIVGGVPVAVVTSGDMKVKGSLLKAETGLKGKVLLPGAKEVFDATGYIPGGVCPFLLPEGLSVIIDSSMRRFDKVYAAGGNDHSAVPITVDRLLEVTGGAEGVVCA
ncbi:MAG: hypothetical protein C0609_06620 [Deltaproteobacteria bacterium]|nr:MAG: hypothetical protein C0609_06620 [Deltaproteobacteria bacterium]